ncbi:MAG TPA: formylglycine-generating enzyme family protein [Candidatus Paceibacterota bacterium]|nr:formylglycine-generating enzyme family protein [Verrucomicrobiota bacterium]HSA09197.1 formylglycine-generating enzyme family protein [Candidatus Paceibacterota bacterium]
MSITGDPGSACTIQYRTGLSPASAWQFLTNLTVLSNSPGPVVETGAFTALRFYRAFSQQLPTNVVPQTGMVWIAPGSFVMGSPTNEVLRLANELQHTVTLTKGFYMGKHEVTQGDYLELIGSNPSRFTTQDFHGNPIDPDLSRPVEQVSWNDATNYCGLLTSREQAAGRVPANWVYRLPSEAEWEYACRAETTNAFHFGSAIHGGMANFQTRYEYDAASGDIHIPNPAIPWLARTTTAGSYLPNAWGLHDLHGNVHEWCQDWFGSYPEGNAIDPQGPPSGSGRVFRGGSWDYWGRFCRSASRYSLAPYRSYDYIGFRVVLAPAQS